MQVDALTRFDQKAGMMIQDFVLIHKEVCKIVQKGCTVDTEVCSILLAGMNTSARHKLGDLIGQLVDQTLFCIAIYRNQSTINFGGCGHLFE